MFKKAFAGLLLLALVAAAGAAVYFLLESEDLTSAEAGTPPAARALPVAATELASEMAPANPPITVPTDPMPIPLHIGDTAGQE